MINNNQYLFLFTIGPVQSFIAQARKTQDLYAGSQILSKLMEEAIKTIKKDGHTIIFPANESGSLPNRLVALVDKEENYLKKFGETIEDAVRTEWKRIAKAPINNWLQEHLKKCSSFTWDTTGLMQQIEQHLEIFWLFEPCKPNYKDAYLQIEKNLGAIKNLRRFEQFTYQGLGEKGRKCSLDGERNAYFFGKGTNLTYLSDKWNPNAIVLEKTSPIKVAKNEGLSAVSFAKRFYEQGGFPSTAAISVASIRYHTEIKILVDQFQQMFLNENDDFDEALLFEENLTDEYFEKFEIKPKARYDKLDVLNKQKEIVNKAKSLNIKQLKYYAILTFDGDNMGKWRSGEYAPNVDLMCFHKQFSRLLGEFANNTVLNEKEGERVYAGGDDFLGFVNLDRLVCVMDKLRHQFEINVNQPLKTLFPTITHNLTFSAGITIAHYKTPLNIVLNKAREMQDVAKKVPEKDAFAIAVLKHSGESHEFAFQWGFDKTLKKYANLADFQRLIDALRNDFSNTWVFNLYLTFALFTDEDNPELDSNFIPMLETEIARLLMRSCKYTGEIRVQKVKDLKIVLFNLLRQMKYHFKPFIDLLNIADFIAAQTNFSHDCKN